MTQFRRIFLLLLVYLAVGLCSSSIAAQESRASLGGKVTDPQDAVIPGASVVVTSVETGVKQRTTTNASGEWHVQYLLPGHYGFTVSASGFKTVDHIPLELQVGDQKTADVRLPLGTATESVVVSSEAPLIDMTAAVSGTVITTKELQDIPTISHIPSLLVGLTPGGIVGAPTGGGAHLWSNISASTLSVNGNGSVAGSGAGNTNLATSYVLDGGYDSNDSGQQAFIPPQDAVREFRVSSNAFDASLGRFTGASLSTVTNSGTKDLHGVGYEYNQNNFLNAHPYNNTKNPPIHVNEYGASIGGPVWLPHLYNGRSKGTFFFFNFDGIQNKTPGSQGTMSLPTMAERKGDFSHSYVVSGGTKYPFIVYDPATTDASGNRTEFPNDQIPTGRLDPVSQAYLAMLPAPDNGGDAAGPDSNNYVKNEVQDDQFKSWIARIDQNWNNANHTYLSLRRNDWSEISYDPFGANNFLNGIGQSRKNKGLTLDHTVVLNPRMVLDLRYNVTNYDGTSFSSALGVDPTSFHFSKQFASLMPVPSLPLVNNGSVTTGAVVVGAEANGIGTNQDSYDNDLYQTIYVTLNQTHGNHSFKYGVEHMIEQEGTGGLGQVGGSFTFGNNWTVANPNKNNGTGSGSGLGSFLLGLPTSGSFPINASAFWSQHYTAAYFQDDWRVSSNFTLNMGLRWDYETGLSERHGKDWTRYDLNYVQTGVTGPSQSNYAKEISGSSTNTGIQLLQQFRSDASSFVTRGAFEYAGVHGTPNTLTNPRYRYFQPRLGFAYRLTPTTVVRGGLGRFAQGMYTLYSFGLPSQTGFSQSTNYVATTNNYQETNPANWDNAFSSGLQQPTGNSLAEQTNIGQVPGTIVDPNVGRIYTDEYYAGVEQEIHKYILEAGFTYNHSRDLPLSLPTNAPSSQAYIAANTPTFDSTGKPSDPLPGSQTVPNPYKGVAGFPTSSSQYTSTTVPAIQLLRPNPVVNSDINVNFGGGRETYYAFLLRMEKRYQSGFSLRQSFTWARDFTQDFTLGNADIQIYVPRQIYSNDVRFHYTAAPIYELPFGRGKRFLANDSHLLEELVGGWEFTGIYNFQSGTPIVLPTNSAFYRGDPSPHNNITKGRNGTWVDTTAFYPYPTKTTCRVHTSNPPCNTGLALSDYPAWTGISTLPGYNYNPTPTTAGPNNGVYQDFATRNTLYPQTFGDIRNPPVDDVTLGVRKNFRITETMRIQLRMDAFNALNHPRYSNVGTDATSPYFGKVGGSATPSAANGPRAIELAGKFYF